MALALIGGAAFIPVLTFAQSYTVIDLGTPGSLTNSGTYSLAHAISQSGAVAGEWGQDAFSERAFLFANSANNDLGILPTTYDAIAYSVNSSNLVVGECFGATDTRAFLYTNGTMVDLTTYTQTIGNYTYSIAHAISAAGKVVGESFVSSANSDIHAVIFLGNRQATDLGTLTNGTYSTAYGINNSDVIVGESTVFPSGNVYAFIYSNSVMSALGTFPGGNYSAAFAINDSGETVGEASTSNGETHGFVFNNGVMTDLGTFGGTNSSASAVNSAGQVVGYALTANQDQHAFLYNGTTMYDLNNLISATLCTNLIAASGINAAGQIAAYGDTPDGIVHAFLLTPAFNVTNPRMITNQQYQLTVQGSPGQQFVIQCSTNFVNWISLATNTLISSSTNWVDARASNWLVHFYRAQLQ